jgi:hypothetical protein
MSHKLLLKLARDGGATPYDLEKKEREILSDLSLRLPESSSPGGWRPGLHAAAGRVPSISSSSDDGGVAGWL